MSDLTVLCVDGDDDAREETTEALTRDGVTAIGADTVAEATDMLETRSVDCVVTEHALPDGSGLTLLASVRGTAPDLPHVLYTDADPSDIDTSAFEGAIIEYLPKGGPGGPERLGELVVNLVENRTQVAYPVPDAEDERIAALDQYDVEELDAGVAFDRLTKLAWDHFDVDTVFIGLMLEHEEEFVTCYGSDVEQLDRENTICTHTIFEDEVMVVENVQADERFAGNERLAELDIRSYAGAPLITPDGQAIGSFCLLHDEPRSYSEAKLEFLRHLADETMEQFELRRRLSAADESEEEVTQ
jgi:CheY-like chemotaxis protein